MAARTVHTGAQNFTAILYRLFTHARSTLGCRGRWGKKQTNKHTREDEPASQLPWNGVAGRVSARLPPRLQVRPEDGRTRPGAGSVPSWKRDQGEGTAGPSRGAPLPAGQRGELRREGRSERGLGSGGSRPRLAAQGARLPARHHPFAPRPSASRSALKAPARPHQPLPRPQNPGTRESSSLGLPLSQKNGGANPARSSTPSAHHCARAQGAAPSAALSIGPLSPACLAILLTGTFERLVHPRRLYLLRDNPEAKGLLFSQTNVTSRRAAVALEQTRVWRAVGALTSGA